MGGDVSKNYTFSEVDLTSLKLSLDKDQILTWKLIRAVPIHDIGDEDVQEFSAFDYGENQEQFSNACMILRSIRHPNIISIKIDPCWKSLKGCGFMTELVDPLFHVLPSLHFHEIMGGLHDLCRALTFLHNSAKICHKSIKLQSLFVPLDGRWKLGCFESAKRVSSGNYDQDKKDLLSLAEELIEKLENLKDDDLTSLADFHKEAEELLIPAHGTSHFPSRVFQRFKFVQIRTFLTEMLVKSDKEKIEFFQSLTSELNQLPEELVARRLSTLLLQRFVLLDKTAREYFLPSFLTPKENFSTPPSGIMPVLEGPVFVHYVCPVLLKVFTIHETSIRLVLLENFSRYFRFFSEQQLQDIILNQLLLSARDQNDQLVELSLRALSDLVPVLGGDLIIRSERIQHFYDGQMKAQKASQSHSNFEDTTSLVENSSERLDEILKIENPSEQESIGRIKHMDTKKLVSTIDLSETQLGNCKKAFEDMRLPEKSQKLQSLQGTWENYDLTTSGSINLEEDLVKSKSLENLSKNQLSSKITKPVAVIEPKTIYQVAASDTDNIKNVKQKLTSSLEGMHKSIHTKSEGCCDKSDTTLKNAKAKDISSSKSFSINDSKIALPTTTLLNISKGVSSDISKPKMITRDRLTQSSLEGSQEENEWDEKWEDLEPPFSLAECIPTPEPLQTSLFKKSHSISTNCDKNVLSKTSNKSNLKHLPLNYPLKVSEMPLGFGYDVKQIQIKVKPQENVDDYGWKLFEELMPSLGSKTHDHKSALPNFHALRNIGKSRVEKQDILEEVGTSGWESDELDLDLEV